MFCIIIMCRPWMEWWKRLIQIYAKQFYPYVYVFYVLHCSLSHLRMLNNNPIRHNVCYNKI